MSNKYTIISATNRIGSNTLKVALEVQRIVKKLDVEAGLFSLTDLPTDLFTPSMYTDEVSPAYKRMEKEVLIPTIKFIIVMPEYNGTMPGILKAMIDASDVKACWYNKKVCLTGVASGRAGNLRGMEHITGSLNHMHMNVFWNKLPLSSVHAELDENNKLKNEGTIKALTDQLQGFINY